MMEKAVRRSFLGWLREYVGDRRRAPRRSARFSARVPAAVTLIEDGAEFAPGASGSPPVAGETRDLGPSGLTLIVNRVRVKGQYLTDPAHQLGIKLELPAGVVSVLARAVRFEHPPEGGGEPGYLVGLRILKVREEDLALYYGFLRTLAPVERRRGGRERALRELLMLATPGGEMSRREDVLLAEEGTGAFERGRER